MNAVQTAFDEYDVQAGDVRIRVRVGGDGPLMVFLHGITANRMVWQPVAEALASDFRTVSVDQRGHGESDAPSGYAASDFVRDVDHLIADFGEDRAIVVGHSLGARNALAAAALSPSRIHAVVAIEFTPFIDTSIFDALEERVLAGARDFSSMEEITSYLRRRYQRLPDDAIVRRAEYGFTRAGSAFRPKADPGAMAETARRLREDIRADVENIAVPALIMRGAESTFVTADAFESTRKLRPDFPSIVVTGADHYVPEEAPEEVARAIREFIGDHAGAHPKESQDLQAGGC